MVSEPKPCEIKLSTGRIAIVDEADFEKANSLKWYTSLRPAGTCYAMRRTKTSGTVYLHRFIMNAARGQIVDHINRNGLDNRRCNLRFVTFSQNSYNSPKPSKSGYRGIRFKHGLWFASLIVDGVATRGVSFRDPISAAHDYDKLARRLRGEFAWLNFPEASSEEGENL